MVVKMSDGTPMKNASVWLDGEDREHWIAATTGPDGNFALANIPSGKYKLRVSRNGYVTAEYGQQKPSDPGATFSLSPGQEKKSLLFRLIPAAVIAGRVFGEDGEPMQRATVTALKEVYYEGRRTLATRAMVNTDDLGQFRLFGLAPGRYFVSAADAQWHVVGDREFLVGAEQEPERGYIKTYYPGTSDAAKALAISVREGEEVPGADFILKAVAVFRVRGRVVNQTAHNKGANLVNLNLLSRARGLELHFNKGFTVSRADGTFEISGVIPGSYTLSAIWSDQEKTYSTREKLEVRESDLEGVTLVLSAGANISGQIVWDGKPSVDGELSIRLQPAENSMYFRGMISAPFEKGQEFILKEIMDGEYRVSVDGLGKDCYIKDTVYGDAHAADAMISVGKGGNAHLELIVSSRGARVQGAVADKDGLPATGVWVVAVPDEARRGIPQLFKAQTTDQYGKFDLHGLAPGSYQVFSWTGIENGEWQDEDFLKEFEKKGEAVEVRDEDTKTLNLTVVQSKSRPE